MKWPFVWRSTHELEIGEIKAQVQDLFKEEILDLKAKLQAYDLELREVTSKYVAVSQSCDVLTTQKEALILTITTLQQERAPKQEEPKPESTAPGLIHPGRRGWRTIAREESEKTITSTGDSARDLDARVAAQGGKV